MCFRILFSTLYKTSDNKFMSPYITFVIANAQPHATTIMNVNLNQTKWINIPVLLFLPSNLLHFLSGSFEFIDVLCIYDERLFLFWLFMASSVERIDPCVRKA